MEVWREHVRRCRRAHGVSTLAAAAEDGVAAATWRRRTRAEGWSAPYPGVRIAPWADDGLAPVLGAVVAAHGRLAAVTGIAAAWWRGVAPEPAPAAAEVVVSHGLRVRRVDGPVPRDREDRQWRARCRRVIVCRCRWLEPGDLEVLRGLRVTRPEVTAIHLAAGPPAVLRAYLVDGRHQGWLDLAAVRARLARLGPVRGRHRLRAHLDELGHRAVESVFHDQVLDTLLALGYAPTTHPVSVPTATGRAVAPDIPLEHWRVAIELDGDAFHRDRGQRRRDRDRLAAYATTDWRPVIVDWRSWHDERETLLATLDAAIEAQRRRGIGSQHPPPARAGSSR